MTDKKWVEFYCTECDTEFSYKMGADDPDPECSVCWQRERSQADKTMQMLEAGEGPASIKTIHGADVAYRMLEKDCGLTNLNDQLREGDVAYKADSPPSRSEQSAMIRAELAMMEARVKAQPSQPIDAGWNGAPQAPAQGDAKAAIAASRAYAEQARREKADPVAYTSEAWRKPANVVEGSKHVMDNASKSMPGLKVLSRANREGQVVPMRRR